ncbi:hypothetical protein, partial [Marinifilum sp. D714]|uniref:hypothetical protein n=1 Tax=Marinifilum sp. D714 TaxID=2937523 RepID=UPI0027C1977F
FLVAQHNRNRWHNYTEISKEIIMQLKLEWRKNIFSTLYRIYSNGQQIGILKDKMFSQTANGELNGKKYTFNTKGCLDKCTEIIDHSENKVIGNVTYNTWMTKATILINNRKIDWTYDNVWNTRWSIFNTEGINIKYSGSSASGQIHSNTDDSLLLLCGLYVTNYYWQMTITVLIAVFVPIWIIVLR